MYRSILLIFALLFLHSCNTSNDNKSSVPKDWEMIEVYGDEIDELNNGGYYGLFYDRDNPLKDSFLEDSDDRIVAIAVSDSLVVNQSGAYIWAADAKHRLVLTEDKTEKKTKYYRKYANDIFTVTLDMKFWERIDGLDEADMYIYRGKMTITVNENGNSKEYRVKGGI